MGKFVFGLWCALIREIMTGNIQSESERAGKMFSPRKI